MRKKFNINILTIKQDIQKHILSKNIFETKIIGVISPEYIFQANDILIVFGHIADIKKWLDKSTI